MAKTGQPSKFDLLGVARVRRSIAIIAADPAVQQTRQAVRDRYARLCGIVKYNRDVRRDWRTEIRADDQTFFLAQNAKQAAWLAKVVEAAEWGPKIMR